jgi:2-oxoglutarate dehydrogenase E2 component (dihydrolipoamide succinyltransferase)
VTKTVDAKEAVAAQLISLILKILIAFGKNIAKEEGVSVAELASISGTGKEGRVTKNDILEYVKKNKSTSSFGSSCTCSKPVAAVAQKQLGICKWWR